MKMDLKALSGDAIAIIRKDWLAQLGALPEDSSYLLSTVERIVDWCEKVLETNSHCLFTLNENDSVRAVIEIADASRSKDPSFKFLNIYLEPNLITDYKEEVTREDLVELSDVFTFALVKSLQLARSKGTRKLKVFGRTDAMISMFDAMVYTAAPEKTGGATLFRQGKWLIIT